MGGGQINDKSWKDMSWKDQSWKDMSWKDQSWKDNSWRDNSRKTWNTGGGGKKTSWKDVVNKGIDTVGKIIPGIGSWFGK